MPTRDQWGSRHHNWRGGRKVHAGYVFVYCPAHPRAVKRYVQEHRLVVERVLGHLLPAAAVVHHVNEQRTDNRNANLVALENGGEHKALHARLRVLRAGGNPWTQRMCSDCGPCDRDAFDRKATGQPSCRCRDCHRARMRHLYVTRPKLRMAKASLR